MSLFPAYAEEAKSKGAQKESNNNAEWLQNSSFKADLAIINKDDVTEEALELSDEPLPVSDNEAPKAKRKKKSSKNETPKSQIELTSDQNEFAIDKVQTREYLTVNTISRPAVAKYRTKYYLTKGSSRKKRRIKRYFKIKSQPKEIEEDDNPEETTLKTHNVDSSKDTTGLSQEEELSKMTAFYNKNLGENSSDIQMWLKYVEFQDTVYHFEKSYRKGSIAKAQRVLAERKISILDKGLSFNPSSQALWRERLKVALVAFPADELQSQLKALVEKEKGNIILWQGYIEATQCSMSHCNTSAVMSLYGKCLSTLHQLRRSALFEKHIFEENILRMLYQCGLFLKQAGLFEQLWTLLKLYLELNLSPTNKDRFNIERYVNEKEFLELEEVVLNSQLPHHELWLRTEKLRESCHWLPFVGDQECEDPQRMVFNEDVVELIHPITMNENIFKLVAITLTLLKIPLLPCRHTTMEDLGLDYVPWSLDSVEALLPVFVNMHSVDISNENLLKNTSRLAVGPQYLKVLPGQDEYLDFILSVMENCAECLKNQDQLSVRIWWFRFQRLLVILENQSRFKMPNHLKKKIKTKIKDFLKREECRNNEIFYVEYALFEKSLGNADKCKQILNTALSMNRNTGIVTDNWNQSQINQCYLYRVLVEEIIETSFSKDTVLSLLVKLVLQRNFEAITNGLIMEAETRFKIITNQLLDAQLLNLEPVEHFLPDFFTDWLICNGWFLFCSKGPLQCGTFIETVLTKLDDEKSNSLKFQKEILYEFYCSILFKYCIANPGSGIFKVLNDVIFRAIEKYPNNTFLLAILAKEHSMTKNMGMSAWKVQNLLLKSGRSFATIFTVIINDLVKLEVEKGEAIDSVTGSKLEMDTNFRNKMLSLYKKITKTDMCTRRCGLIWRLYLQFIHNYFDPDFCRNVYYRAVEECPWLKALYIDAAIYIPAELAQIQDLIIEKQLRLHVAPEELDILRS